MNTENQATEFKKLIDLSSRILITSHISPDPDAVASLLLMGTALRHNYPDKQTQMVLEEEPSGLEFLTGYSDIKFEPVWQAAQNLKPDLLIIVDTNTFKRLSRQGYKVKEVVTVMGTKIAIIDHHEPDGKDSSDVFINAGSIAASQEVYELLFDQLKLEKPEGYAQTTMLGLYSDSGGFAYVNPRNRQTMQLASHLVEAGAHTEEIKNRISQYSDEQMGVISHLTSNVASGGDYTYTFLDDEFVDEWIKSGRSLSSLHGATKPFVDNYIRNVGGRQWGFLTYKDPLEGDDMYSVSLRSVGGVKDVSQIAQKIDGGGHKAASGAKVHANSVKEAVEKIKQAIAAS